MLCKVEWFKRYILYVEQHSFKYISLEQNIKYVKPSLPPVMVYVITDLIRYELECWACRDLKPCGVYTLCTVWKLDMASELSSFHIAHIFCFVTCVSLPVSILRADKRF